MRQSYLKNAALMTGADVLLRLAGMGLRIYLANALGGEGMGLYQLVLAVYALFVTLATAGVSVAATRLMAEELSRGRAEARGMLGAAAGSGPWAGGLCHGGAVRAGRIGGCLVAGRRPGRGRSAGGSIRDCPGWPSRRCCGGSSSPGGGWSPTCSASWRNRPSASGSSMWCWGRAILRGWDHGRKCTAVLAATALSEAVSALY